MPNTNLKHSKLLNINILNYENDETVENYVKCGGMIIFFQNALFEYFRQLLIVI